MNAKKFFLLAALFVSPLLFSACNPADWKVKAGLQVKISDDTPATLYLDGKYLDKTPYINKEIEPGDYTLEIRPDDPTFISYTTKISLKKGTLTFVVWKPGKRPETSGGAFYEMEKLSDDKHAEFSITTIPDGAILHVDDVTKGFAPTLVNPLSEGEHSYEVTLPSYETQKNTANVQNGYRTNVIVKLAKLEVPQASPTPATTDAAQAIPVAIPVPPVASPAPITPPTLSTTPTIIPTPSPQVSAPKSVIQPTHFFLNNQQVLRVHTAASASSPQIGTAPVGSEYPYLGQSTDGAWYEISFSNNQAWVSKQYTRLIQ